MRLKIEIKIPADTHGALDIGEAKNQIANALEYLPSDISVIESITVPVRDYNGNRIGDLFVGWYE